MTIKRTALLVGATGLVGRHVLAELKDSADYSHIHVFGRRSIGDAGGKLVVRVEDFDNLHELAACEPDFFAVEDVFCCLGTTIKAAGSQAAFEAVDYGHVVALARACREHGARRFFLVSAVGANAGSSNFYSRTKGRTEEAVSALGYETVCIVRPSLLLGARDDNRPAEAVGQRLAPLLSPLFAGPLRKLRPVRAETVAQHIIELPRRELTGVHISYPGGA